MDPIRTCFFPCQAYPECVHIVYTESFVLGPFFVYDIFFVTPVEIPRPSLDSFPKALEGCQKTLGEDDLDDGFAPGLFVRIRIESEGFGRSGSKKSS